MTVVLNKLLEENKGGVHRVMTELKLQTVSDSDVGFLTEDAQVMSNAAKALNQIRRVDQDYFESFLPTIVATVMKMKEA